MRHRFERHLTHLDYKKKKKNHTWNTSVHGGLTMYTRMKILLPIILIIFDQIHPETQKCQLSKSDFEANYLFLQKKFAS